MLRNWLATLLYPVRLVIARLMRLAFLALYYPLAPFYDQISHTAFVGQWSKWQKAVLPRIVGKRVLELGCGTGNLTAMIARAYPKSELVAVDFSGEALAECRRKLAHSSVSFLQEDFARLSFAKGEFDLVISSIAIHHLADGDKSRLFQGVFQWLGNGGIFTFADQFRGETD